VVRLVRKANGSGAKEEEMKKKMKLESNTYFEELSVKCFGSSCD
jgi:hypothetical protein